MRTFDGTHPWITFALNLNRPLTTLWVLLGEASSKIEHIEGVPLQPVVAQTMHRLFMAKGVLATTAIEGNTLSEEEVIKHMEGRLELPRSKEYLKTEVDNILKACERITTELAEGQLSQLSRPTIQEYNRLVLAGLPGEEGTLPGEVRSHSVTVGNYRGAPAEDCAFLLDRLCEWLNSKDFEAPGQMSELKMPLAIIKAIMAHLYIAWIHPFGNGNGRTARLIELHILISAGVPTPAAHLLSNHYNQTRSEYYRMLDLASKSGGDVIPFLQYAAQGFVDGLREQISLIRGQQWHLAWRDFVDEAFGQNQTAADQRRKMLLLDLSWHEDDLSASEIRILTPRVAAAYAAITSKGLTRDLNALIDMGLVLRQGTTYRARTENILAFLPLRHTPKP